MKNENEKLEELGKYYIGKKAQSRFITGLNSSGNKIFLPADLITAYEIVEEFQEPALRVIIDGNSVPEDSLFNINN